jgi:DNA polymerase III subunit epsilon
MVYLSAVCGYNNAFGSYMKKLVCLDTETTGLSADHDRIVEIGCVEITNGWANRTSFQKYINPNRSMPEMAFRIHGLSLEFLSQFEKFDSYADEFLNFIEGATLIIHNANFDMKFLNAELIRSGRKALENEVIDTLTIAKKEFPKQKVNLDALSSYFNINKARDKHGALLDSEILAQIYLAMQLKQTVLSVKQEAKTYSGAAFDKTISISQDEEANHENIIKSLKKEKK